MIYFFYSTVKEGIDDLARYRSDKNVNDEKCEVVVKGEREFICSKDIRVGNLVYVHEDQMVSCDLVVLKSSSEDGTFFVQTANLDGETNLKQKHAVTNTMKLSEEECYNLRGCIECAVPNSEIYRFDSRMKLANNPNWVGPEVKRICQEPDWMNNFEGDIISLDANNILLQGTTLKNVGWILGIAVYTGNETKIGMNKHPAPSKWPVIDRLVNRASMAIFVMQILLSVAWGILGWYYNDRIIPSHFYLMVPKKARPRFNFIITLRFLLLMSMMIPISLRVSMEIAKLICARLIQYDAEIWHNDTPTTCKDSAIAEDLGQIQYIMTDKTGTLTENIMKFNQCYFNGHAYGSLDHPATNCNTLTKLVLSEDFHALNFFKVLALCHTATPSQKAKNISKEDTDEHEILMDIEEEELEWHYKSSSPDEEALVSAAQSLGVELIERTRNILKILVNGKLETYEIIHTLEFSSDRKRMSVLLKHLETEQFFLMCKGSDDMMLPRMIVDETTTAHIDQELHKFANLGLRTLCLGYKSVDESQCQEWKSLISEASGTLEGRELLLEKVYNSMERDLNFVGITAIEDKLQTNVPQTISLLQRAGIHIWMLTGDKHETAIQIAKSCHLLNEHGLIFTFTGSDYERGEELLDSAFEQCILAHEHQPVYTVVDGNAWVWLQTPEFKRRFTELALFSKTVICCRVTPHQKAQMVELIRQENKIVLAVGDGGNDVSMIQCANVGIGLVGKEGTQASKAADFSIGRFHFLAKLILVHGRWAYRRTAFIAQYCFHKSMFIALFQLYFSFYNGFSGSSLFDGISLASYNFLFTGLPVMLYTLDQDLDKKHLLANPQIYRECQKGRQFNVTTILYWVLRTVFQSSLVFFAVLGWWWSSNNRGDGLDHAVLSQAVYGACVILQTMAILLEFQYVPQRELEANLNFWMERGLNRN